MTASGLKDEKALALSAEGIYKQDKGRQTLRGASVMIHCGEIHALLGDSGSGKAALMRILAGADKPDSGKVAAGSKSGLISPEGGIGRLSVADNLRIYSGSGVGGNKLVKLAEKYAAGFGIELDFTARFSSLDSLDRLYVQLLGALASGARLLLFIKPLYGLAVQQAQELFETLYKLSKDNYAVFYSTDVARDALVYSDRCTVLYNGTDVKTFMSKEASLAEAEDAMLGKVAEAFPLRRPPKLGEPVYTAQNLFVAPQKGSYGVSNVSLMVYSGEIVGIASLDGNGGMEIIESLYGLKRLKSGRIFAEELEITGCNSAKIREAGIGMIPDVFGSQGSSAAVVDLLLSSASDSRRRLGKKAAKELTDGFLREFQPLIPLQANTPLSMLGSPEIKMLNLYGELQREPKMLLLHEPLRGLDWNNACRFAEKLIAARDHGNSAIVLSSNADMLLGLCDRIIVVSSGEITAQLDSELTDEDEIGAYMMGARRDRTV
ncbi:MAG: ATP-binding cassette domain-containing protein [Eubacteriales bacterium]|nr:ATP-binding cassette domain-containing protein [Eubacteriales bacterium]MDD3883077.1 ATP-binding cassette domain-containing protein [Eubacteriales bacterium]MDD4512602.1 ATP-binding cassette domain-containing protein [Eubacteriales bacterium]